MQGVRSILTASLVIAVGACSASPPSTSTPATGPVVTPSPASFSAAPPSTPEPTVQATQPVDSTLEPASTPRPDPAMQWAQDPPTPLLMGTAVRVVVDELNVRARPTTAARRVGTFSSGNVVVVGGPPVESEGYVWYSGTIVSVAGDLPALPHRILGSGEPVSGWFAAFMGETPYVALVDARCPSVIDFRNVSAMLPAERLACFGDRSIVLEGTIGCEPCTIHIFGEYEPDWLTNPNAVDNLLWDSWMEGATLKLRFPPDGPSPPRAGRIIRVRGHFGDSASATCSLREAYPWGDAFTFERVGSSVARKLCRHEFVVERVEVLGTDPGFDLPN